MVMFALTTSRLMSESAATTVILMLRVLRGMNDEVSIRESHGIAGSTVRVQ